MNNLLKFIIKHHFYFLFIIIEVMCVFLIVQNNDYHKANFIGSANFITGGVQNSFYNVTSYFKLKEENERLAFENAQLYNQLEKIEYYQIPTYTTDTVFKYDTIEIKKEKTYKYNTALIISNSTSKLKNILYINKGNENGVDVGMGVVNADGVIGITTSRSKNFATIMPIINKDFNLSAKIKNQGYFGNVLWDGENPSKASLQEIPSHVILEKGDTIVTSGYSQIFPENIVVGFVSSTQYTEGNYFLEVEIDLAVNFSTLDYVYYIENNQKEELESLIYE